MQTLWVYWTENLTQRSNYKGAENDETIVENNFALCEGQTEKKLTDLLICLPGRKNNSAKLEAKNKKKGENNKTQEQRNKIRVYKILFTQTLEGNKKWVKLKVKA